MAETTLALNSKTFEEKVKAGGIMFVDFWAPWCGPCRTFAPIYETAAGKNADITFAKVNTDEERELASAFEIKGIPTLAIFRDGILLFLQAGALPASALDELIGKVRALDMDDVRKQIAEAERKQRN
jgi:thioredoxin